MEIVEKVQKTFILSNRDGSFETTPGRVVGNGLFAHKTRYFGWYVSDIASGMSLRGHFDKFENAKEYAENMPEADSKLLADKRAEARYQAKCEEVKNAASEELKQFYESISFDEAMDLLDDKSKQLSLFID